MEKHEQILFTFRVSKPIIDVCTFNGQEKGDQSELTFPLAEDISLLQKKLRTFLPQKKDPEQEIYPDFSIPDLVIADPDPSNESPYGSGSFHLTPTPRTRSLQCNFLEKAGTAIQYRL